MYRSLGIQRSSHGSRRKAEFPHRQPQEKSSVQITGLAGGARDVDQDRLTGLAMELDGSVLLPSDEGFADSVALWNGMITKRPAVVVRAASNDDVVRTVNFARENELELSIRGGGH